MNGPRNDPSLPSGDTEDTTGATPPDRTSESNELLKSNASGRFLLGCAGANPDHLKERAELRWYHSLGASIVFTALMAGASLYVLLGICFDLPWQVMAAISTVWAMLVFNLDRLIVARIIGKPTILNKMGLFLSRLVLAVGVAVLMAVGLEILFFGAEIEQRIVQLNDEAQETLENNARTKAETETYKDQLAAPGKQAADLLKARETATTERDTNARAELCENNPTPELNCETGTGNVGPGQRSDDAAIALENARRELREATTAYADYALTARKTQFDDIALAACGFPPQALLTREQEQRCAAQQLVEARVQEVVALAAAQNDKGLIRRLVALADLADDEHGIWVTVARFIFFAVVASVDLIPLSAKLFGGATGHDTRARRDFVTASNEFTDEMNNATRREPHFLDGAGPFRNFFKKIGIVPDYDEAASSARATHYESLFERQSEILQSKWPTVTQAAPAEKQAGSQRNQPIRQQSQPLGDNHHVGVPAMPDSEGATMPDPPKDPKKTSEAFTGDGLYPGKVLEAKNGTKYHLDALLQAKSNVVNQLWLCKRIDVADDKRYVAKCCLREGFNALKRDLASAQVSSPRIIEPTSGLSVTKDTDSNYYFIVLPYYQDGDLSVYQGTFRGDPARGVAPRLVPLEAALSITRQLLEGLADVHERGIVHCDIKPRNILLDLTSGHLRPEIVITDFGAMKLMADHNRAEVTQVFAGTEPYAAPEQLLASEVAYGRRAHATDLWAVGAVLFRMLTHEAPRDRLPGKPSWTDNSDEYKNWLRNSPQPPRLDTLDPSIPASIADVVATWLSKDPASRVSPEVNLETQNSRDVMDDAIARLDDAMAML